MIEILRTDITRLPVDAIVNAANETLRGGGGVDGAIHRAAGPELLEECERYRGCAIGDAVLTGGYRLPARYVIHAVGPAWQDGSHGEKDLLKRAYESVFRVAAAQSDIHSLAFPAISTGAYGFPKRAAAEIAIAAMRAHEASFARLVACVFDDETRALYEELLKRPRN